MSQHAPTSGHAPMSSQTSMAAASAANSAATGAVTSALLPGFDNPVDDAQQVFRAALDAFAHPGMLQALPAASVGRPAGLSPAMTALLLTLADSDTPVWLPADIGGEARAFLRFHCGCPLVDNAAQATFVCVPMGDALPSLAQCAQGDPAYPDRSATLLVELAALSNDAATGSDKGGDKGGDNASDAYTLRGPGIETTQTLLASGLPNDFRAQWRANNAGFPLGVDLLLTAGDRFCALPRTTHLED